MSWRKISMKFPGTCIICNKKLEVNEIGLWAKGQGVKHEKCGEINELKCIICGGPDVVKTVLGEEISFQDLGGAITHGTKSGVAHFVAKNEYCFWRQPLQIHN